MAKFSCSGCERRRQWVKKWSKVAYERAKKIIANSKVN